MNFTKFAKTNILFAIAIVVIAFVYPFFIKKVFYANKSAEAVSIAKIIQKIQNLNYVNHSKYISIDKGDTKKLVKSFNIQKDDIEFYNYSIFTTINSYILYAEPKIKYLKSREIAPRIYSFYKKTNQTPITKWQ
jgi:hypothetical protein